MDEVIQSAYNRLPFGHNDGIDGIHVRTQVDALHDRLKGDMETAHSCLLSIEIAPTSERGVGKGKKKKGTTKNPTSTSTPCPPLSIQGLQSSNLKKDSLKTKPRIYHLFSESMKSLCEKATAVWGICLQHQSDRMLPRTNFTSGALSTEKINAREYVGLILLDLLLLCSTLGDHLFSDAETAKEKEITGYSKRGYLGNKRLLQWVDILDTMLLIDGFERATEISERSRRLYGKYLMAYCERHKETLNKNDGKGMQKLKFHSKVHRAEQIEDTGVPDNTDAERTEHFQINACKETAKNTQKRAATLDAQSGVRLTENLIIECNYLDVKHCFEKAGDKDLADTITAKGCSFLLSQDRNAQTASYRIYSKPKGKREAPSELAAWSDCYLQESVECFFSSLVEKTFGVEQEDGQCPITPLLNTCTVIDLFTKESIMYHAEPGRRASMARNEVSPGWNDWAMVRFGEDSSGEEKLYPAHLICFLELDCSFVGIDLADGTSLQTPGLFVLCHAAAFRVPQQVHAGVTIIQQLTKDYRGMNTTDSGSNIGDMNKSRRKSRNREISNKKNAENNILLYLLPIQSIVEPFIAVPDIWPRMKKNDFAKDDIAVNKVEHLTVERPAEWALIFESTMQDEEQNTDNLILGLSLLFLKRVTRPTWKKTGRTQTCKAGQQLFLSNINATQ